MDFAFLKILNMSIAAGWLILTVVMLRFLLKKAPRWMTCVLWAAVAIRLASPISFDSALSLIPSAETVSPDILYAQEPVIHSGLPMLNSVANPMITESLAPTPGASVNPLQIWASVAACAWLLGIAVMLFYAAASFLRLRKKVNASLKVHDNVWICDDIQTPFILGVIKPCIYLPSGMDEAQQVHVIAHENAHLKRRDHLWKPLGFLLLAVYWFNPLCWLAYILLCRDIELACDEKVIRTMDKEDMLSYSEALYSCSVPQRMVMVCPLAFGDVGVKERIKTVLNYKKPAFWIIIVAVVACIAVAVCFLTNPVSEQREINWADRPMLMMDGAAYINPYMPISRLPYGYTLTGTLTKEQANNTDMIGLNYYSNPNYDDFYVYQECGTPVDVNTVDSEQRQWAYLRWIKVENDSMNHRKLTLDDVVMLSKKGNNLQWSDFDRYSYIETGSGLYIRVYEIDEMFELWIGGAISAEAGSEAIHVVNPLYFYLKTNDESEAQIDIRTNNVAAFIKEHEENTPISTVGGSELTGLAYETVYSRVNYSDDGYDAMVDRAENRDIARRYGNVEHLTPLVKLDTKADYDAFYRTMSGYFDFTQDYDESGAFSEQSWRYTDDFFGSYSLFIAYLTEPTSSARHEVEEIKVDNGILEIRICRIAPESGDDAMAGWFIAVAVPKAEITDCVGYDAYICATRDPDQSAVSGNLIREYSFEGEDLTHTASVSLYDSGEFWFTFSPLSSYIGHGEYRVEGRRLMLNTEDGRYTYVFDMVNDTLVFDADASSSMVWYSGLTDGSVFQ